jgi:hypothetical protein
LYSFGGVFRCLRSARATPPLTVTRTMQRASASRASSSIPARPDPPAPPAPQYDTEHPVPDTLGTVEEHVEQQDSLSQGGSSVLDGAQPQLPRDIPESSQSAAKRARASVYDDAQDTDEPSRIAQVLFRNWKGTWGHFGRKSFAWAFWVPASKCVQVGVPGKTEELECLVCHAERHQELHPMVPRDGEHAARALDTDVTSWLPEDSNLKKKSKPLLGQHTM